MLLPVCLLTVAVSKHEADRAKRNDPCSSFASPRHRAGIRIFYESKCVRSDELNIFQVFSCFLLCASVCVLVLKFSHVPQVSVIGPLLARLTLASKWHRALKMIAIGLRSARSSDSGNSIEFFAFRTHSKKMRSILFSTIMKNRESSTDRHTLTT